MGLASYLKCCDAAKCDSMSEHLKQAPTHFTSFLLIQNVHGTFPESVHIQDTTNPGELQSLKQSVLNSAITPV
jgi:hypothetical protein